MQALNPAPLARFSFGLKADQNSSTHIDCIGFSAKGGVLYIDCGTQIQQYPIESLAWFNFQLTDKALLACLARGV